MLDILKMIVYVIYRIIDFDLKTKVFTNYNTLVQKHCRES